MSSRIICFALILAIVVCSGPVTTHAQSTNSPWLAADPVLKEVQSTIPESSIPGDCIPDTKFVTAPRNILKAQSEKSFTACATVTPFGLLAIYNSEQYLLKNNTSVAGMIKTALSVRFFLSSIPGTNDVIYNTNEPVYGAYRRVVRNFPNQLATESQSDGSIYYRVTQTVQGKTFDDAANIPINFSGTKFSNDGGWFVGNAHQRGIYRINSKTGAALNYGGKYNHAIGMSPNFVSAISNDGRYVIETEDRYGIFRIYDLATCIPNPIPADQATCQSKELFNTIPPQIKNLRRVARADFSTDYTIRLYIERTDNSRALYTLTAAGQVESLVDYLALGDSFTSGEGAYAYKTGTDVHDKNTCHLSHLSYPYLLPSRVSINAAQSVACSGGKMKDITNSEYPEYDAQSKGKNGPEHNTDIFRDYLPGYRPQWHFIQKNKPQNVTVSIGGNDIGFGSILTSCIGPGTCYNTEQQKLNLGYTIANQFPRLVATYQKIKEHAQTNANIFVIGYPYLAKSNGNCAQNVLLNNSEIQFSNEIIDYLNLVIKRAADKAGVTYINTQNAFYGHRLCETKSSNVAVNGLTAGDDKTFSFTIANKYSIEGYVTGRESYHPNQLGHRLLADTIAQ